MTYRNCLYSILVLCLSLALAACGGSTSGGDDDDGGDSDSGGSTPVAAGVTLIAETPTLPSAADSAAEGITLTAIIRDESNNVVQGQSVGFAASSGALQIQNQTTSENGTASALLSTGGDPRNRTITVTASAGSQQDTIDIDVTGTTIALQGPQAISAGGQATFTSTLTDSDDVGIADRPLTVSSANGNTLGSSSLQTNAQGVATFQITGTISGQDTITASALGTTRSVDLTVGGASFAFTAPDGDTEADINEPVDVVLNWRDGNGPVTGETVRFSSSRGTFSSSSVTTDGNGNARTTLTSSDAGPATVTATGTEGRSASLQLQFVATNAVSIIAQAEPATVSAGNDSTITATVRDDNGNLVSNALVEFNLQDTSGGRIQPSQQRTNAQGRATATYTAGATSAGAPARITVSAADAGISDTVSVTVGGQALRITLGTGGELDASATTTYDLPYVALVTDASGNPVSDASFRLSVQSIAFQEGLKVVTDNDGDGEPDTYSPYYEAPKNASDFGCMNEDVNGNGILDADEDINGNGMLDPGNVASVPRTVALDDTGAAEFSITYPKNFSGWVKVRLRGTASVQGSESTQNVFFVLPMGIDDHRTGNDTAPPGATSPFGMDGDCATTFDPDTGEEQ